ncbi:MAG: phosphoribosylglycinamide synthetase C domain-containing protein, partial [Opitutaceae bacterium]
AGEEMPAGTAVLHAGTARDPEGRLVSAGGRVLGVVASAETLERARDRAYAACERIDWPGKRYRRDIGARQIAHAAGARLP